MANEKYTSWTKTCSRTVDQRDLRLPPTWSQRESKPPRTPQLGRYIHRTGRSRAVAQRLVELMGTARWTIVVSSFLLADEEIETAMLQAAKRGVRVYVLLASETRLGREENDGEFEQRVLATHKATLNRLGGYVLFRSARHFHAKFVLVDPHQHPAGILLTANLTSAALERNEELAVRLSADEVREAARLAGWAMWETAEHEMTEAGRFRAVKPLERLSPPPAGTSIRATTSERNELSDEALAVINSARCELAIACYGWDRDHIVVKRLCARVREGLRVTVLARVRGKPMPALVELSKAGATVLGFRWLHAKALWADSGRGLVMSANLEADGLDRGFELGVTLEGPRAEELHERLSTWASAAAWRLDNAPALGDLAGDVKIWHRGQLLDEKIEAVEEVALGSFEAASTDSLEIPPPEVPSAGPLPRLAHELICKWEVRAPRLDTKAKEIKRPKVGEGPQTSYSPPLFKERGGRKVVGVSSKKELIAATALQSEVGAAAIVVMGIK